jgi:predicted nucleic acid-binding protein
MNYLIDTSLILGHVYGDRRASGMLNRLLDNGGELFTTDVIVWECLSRGTDPEREVIEELLDSLTYIPITPAIAREAAQVERATGAGRAETLLAAAAASIGATLVRLPVPGSA